MFSQGIFTRWRHTFFRAIFCFMVISFPSASYTADLHDRLGSGEIIFSCDDVPGTPLKRGEAKGVVDAPPEIVWQVITDVNNFKEFMPRTLKSMTVRPERVQVVMQKKPARPKEVEALLDPVPPDPKMFRVPGQKYTVYFYSLLDFPWPVRNRWYIIKILQDETSCAGHIYKSSWSLEIGNLRENCGEWLLEPFATNQTKVTYRLFTDPGGHVPDFLCKKGTLVTMPQIISSVRKRVGDSCPR
ncbi:MAG: hypothetical protein FJ134_10105 [Deltaproteobacteria bacterium]|nr:hypothetical protein [Deltaproteobacteria bacterium]